MPCNRHHPQRVGAHLLGRLGERFAALRPASMARRSNSASSAKLLGTRSMASNSMGAVGARRNAGAPRGFRQMETEDLRMHQITCRSSRRPRLAPAAPEILRSIVLAVRPGPQYECSLRPVRVTTPRSVMTASSCRCGSPGALCGCPRILASSMATASRPAPPAGPTDAGVAQSTVSVRPTHCPHALTSRAHSVAKPTCTRPWRALVTSAVNKGIAVAVAADQERTG